MTPKFLLILIIVCAGAILAPPMLGNHIQIVFQESNYTISEESLCRGCGGIQSFENYVELENENQTFDNNWIDLFL